MPTRKRRAQAANRDQARNALLDIAGIEVMPPCSTCITAKERCCLRAGDGACKRCILLGRKCNLFLTLEDGIFYFPVRIFVAFFSDLGNSGSSTCPLFFFIRTIQASSERHCEDESGGVQIEVGDEAVEN